MLIERPPEIFRMWLKDGIFRMPHPKVSGVEERKVYLTFDDGPIPEVTPWVLDLLDRYGVKATFFMVGDNVRRNLDLFAEVSRRGHSIGNHTMHHLQGSHVTTRRYLRDVEEAHRLIGSTLFRPPHGWLRQGQSKALRKKYRLIMYDLVTRDYSKHLDADAVVANVMRYTRPGAIIVFHDSLKSWPRLQTALPRAIEWLRKQGYEFGIIDDGRGVRS